MSQAVGFYYCGVTIPTPLKEQPQPTATVPSHQGSTWLAYKSGDCGGYASSWAAQWNYAADRG